MSKDISEEFESKKWKIRNNEWRKLSTYILIIIAFIFVYKYNFFDYTGYILGFLILFITARLIHFVIDKIFGYFIK